MAQFLDAAGRKWTLTVTAGTIKTVRSEAGIDLADHTGATLDRLANDPVLLVDTLWLLVRDQARGRDLTDRDFGEGLVGDAIDAASAALEEAICDFFPQARRLILRRLADTAARVRRRTADLAIARLADPTMEDRITSAIEAQMNRAIDRLTPLPSAGASPESSGSTPTPEP
jgi:hypothetical protein